MFMDIQSERKTQKKYVVIIAQELCERRATVNRGGGEIRDEGEWYLLNWSCCNPI